MTSNMLYYQTNYLISILVVFVLISLCSPGKLLIGLFSLVFATAIYIYLKKNKPAVEDFGSKHRFLTILAIFLTGYLAVYLLDAVMVFLLATLFPILLIFIHASLRQRNLKNKINDKMESTGLKKTPMGSILEFLGQEFDKLE